MGIQPEMAIFRTFGELNIRNLLYLQAAICDLEKKLQEQEIKDYQTKEGGSKSSYTLDWYYLRHSYRDGDTKQLDLVLKIRQKLKEYSKYKCC